MWVEPARRDTRARALTLALEKLRPLMGPEDTLLVLPEGAALNFWLRRPSPAPYMLYNPTELAAFGGAAAVADRLRAHPPDFVALLDRPLGEFGLGRFGQSDATGKPILDWVHENYRPIARVGPEPFSGSGEFGLELRRRARTGPAAHSR
jgi:hypothetical protein